MTFRALFVAILMTAPAAATLLAAPVATAGPSPVGDFLREDPDGVTTITVLIQDEHGVVNAAPLWKDPCVNPIDPAGVETPPVCASVPAPPDPALQNLMTYTNAWTHTWGAGSSPMLTAGIMALTPEGKGIRMPLVVFENLTAPASPMLNDPFLLAFESFAMDLALNDALPMALNSAGYPANYAAPDAASLTASITGFGSTAYPHETPAYRDYDTIFGWFTLRNEPRETWAGYYVHRTGSASETGGDVDLEKRVEIGAASRMDGREKRWGAVYLEQDVSRSAKPGSWEAENDLTLGTRLLSEDLDLFGLRMWDKQEGGAIGSLPQDEETGFAAGTFDTEGEWTPLVGTESQNHYDFTPQGIPQTQLWSFGPYVDGEYVPLVGIEFSSERWPRTFWALFFALGGTLGDQTAGDIKLKVGAFVDGEFTPLVGVELDDSWKGAQYKYQTIVKFGAYVDGDFEPLVAYAYSGQYTWVAWVSCMVFGVPSTLPLGHVLGLPLTLLGGGGIGSKCQDWEMVIATFVNDEMQPLLTIDYKDDYAGAKYAWQAQIIVGTFVAGQRTPLFAYTYSGELPLTTWSLVWALSGTLGASAGDWRMETGTFVGGVFKPLLTIDYKDDYADADHERQAMIIVGTVVEGKEQPLLAYTYDGEQALASWALAFGLSGALGSQIAGDWEMEIGTFVDTKFVPVVGWTYANDFDAAHHPYQSEITAGVYVLGKYQPIVGITYDAEQTLLEFAANAAGGFPESNNAMIVAVGTYAGDHYLPLLGVRYDTPDDSTYKTEETVQVGTFLLGYDWFVPLAGVRLVGDESVGEFAQAWASAGTLGGKSGDQQAYGDVYLLEKPAASARLAYEDDVTQDKAAEGTAEASLVVLDRETPRLAVKYKGDDTLATYAQGLALGGGPGCACGDVEIQLGLVDPKTKTFTPIAFLRATDEGTPTPDYPNGMRVTVGAVVDGAEVPLASATYESQGPLVDAGNPQHPFLVEAAAYKPGGVYWPLLEIAYRGGTTVEAKPLPGGL